MGLLNRYGFDAKETITNLIAKHGLKEVDGSLYDGDKLVFQNPRSGNKARLKATWLFFKDLRIG